MLSYQNNINYDSREIPSNHLMSSEDEFWETQFRKSDYNNKSIDFAPVK